MARRGLTALPPGSLRPSAVPRSRQVRHGLRSRARRSARHMPSRAHARPAPPFAGSLSRYPALCRRSVLSPFRRFVHIPSPRGSRRGVWMSAREGAPTCVACARREVRRARALHAIGRRALRMGGGWMHEASLRAIRSDRPMMTNAPGPKTCSAPSSGRGRAGMVGRGLTRVRARLCGARRCACARHLLCDS